MKFSIYLNRRVFVMVCRYSVTTFGSFVGICNDFIIIIGNLRMMCCHFLIICISIIDSIINIYVVIII